MNASAPGLPMPGNTAAGAKLTALSRTGHALADLADLIRNLVRPAAGGRPRVASDWTGGQFTGIRCNPFPFAGAHSLTTATWVTMIVIGAFVWGGFALVLAKAVRTESEKSEAERA